MTTAVQERVEKRIDTVVLGERLGFYKILGDSPVTPIELAERAGVSVVFVRDWLNDQAREGYLTYDPATDRYSSWCELPQAHWDRLINW
jgi:hypothetical protein